MFGAEIADALGLNLESGIRTWFRTANTILAAQQERLENWRLLQEPAGVK